MFQFAGDVLIISILYVVLRFNVFELYLLMIRFRCLYVMMVESVAVWPLIIRSLVVRRCEDFGD